MNVPTEMRVSISALEWKLLLALAATGDMKKAVADVAKGYTRGFNPDQLTLLGNQLKEDHLDDDGRRLLGRATHVEVIR